MAVICQDYYTNFNDSFNNLPIDRDNFEYEQSAPAPTLKGRLKSRVSYWESINANRFIADVIKFGYRIPFISTPLAKRFSNNKSALAHHDFVANAILELVANSAILEVPLVPLVVSLISRS